MKKATLGLLALTATLFLQAQQRFANLNEVYSFADKANLGLQAGAKNFGAVQVNEALVRTDLSPKLQGFGTVGYDPVLASQVVPAKLFGGADDKFAKLQFGTPFNFSGGVEASYPLLNFEKHELIKTAEWQTKKAGLAVEGRKEALHDLLAEHYFSALALKKLIALNRLDESTCAAVVALMQKRLEAGIVSPADVNRAKILLFDVQSGGVAYAKRFEQTLNALKTLLNISSNDDIRLTDSLSIDWSSPAVKNIAEKAALQEAEVAYQLSLQQGNEAKKSSLPKLSFNARYYQQWQATNKGGGQTLRFDAATLGLRLDVPLFSGGFYKLKTKKAALLSEAMKLESEQVQAKLISEQRDHLLAFQQAKKAFELVEQKAKAAAENLRIATLNVAEGVMDFDTYATFFREHTKAQIERVEAMLEALLNKTLIEQ